MILLEIWQSFVADVQNVQSFRINMKKRLQRLNKKIHKAQIEMSEKHLFGVRGTWKLNPVTKVIPSKKIYTRKQKHGKDYE